MGSPPSDLLPFLSERLAACVTRPPLRLLRGGNSALADFPLFFFASFDECPPTLFTISLHSPSTLSRSALTLTPPSLLFLPSQGGGLVNDLPSPLLLSHASTQIQTPPHKVPP